LTVDMPFPRKRCTHFGTLLLRAPIPVPTDPPLYKDEPKTLGEHLLKRRIERGMSTCDLASEIGVSRATINNWEGDRSVPAVRFEQAVARFLERDLQQLLADGVLIGRPAGPSEQLDGEPQT
jgi:DNA-binding XRE family transcriptional regulator